jgi:membrane protease YdiL (CAAX protease family)
LEPESQSASPTRRDLALRGLAFLAIFIVYQASEALQTVLKAGGAAGPALMLAALLLAWPAGRLIDRAPWRAYGLEWRRGAADVMAVGLALAFLAKLAALAAGLSVGAYGPAAAPPPGLSIAAVALAAFTTFVPSLVEDILTRGLLLRAPLRLTFWTYTFGSAAIYTLNHVWRFGWGPSEQIRLFCLGLAYGAAAWRWNSLWAAVALHWGWNFASAVTDLALPIDGLDPMAGRYVSAGAHLIVLLIVARMPTRDDERQRRAAR